MRHVLPKRTTECPNCKALMWIDVRINGSSKINPQFSLCCKLGQVNLPKETPLPEEYQKLLTDNTEKGNQFRDCLRMYNSALAFTSTWCQLDEKIMNNNKGSYTFRMCGGMYHYVGDYECQPNSKPKFAQIYIYDQAMQVRFRENIFTGSKRQLKKEVIEYIQNLLHDKNPYVHIFEQAGKLKASEIDYSIVLKNKKVGSKIDKRYNLPVSDEIAVLMPSSNLEIAKNRDVLIIPKHGDREKMRISELKSSYDPLSYPIMFVYGEQGWSPYTYPLSKKTVTNCKSNQVPIDQANSNTQELSDLMNSFHLSCGSATSEGANSLETTRDIHLGESLSNSNSNENESLGHSQTNDVSETNVGIDKHIVSNDENNHNEQNHKKQKFVTALQFYSYKLQDRKGILF